MTKQKTSEQEKELLEILELAKEGEQKLQEISEIATKLAQKCQYWYEERIPRKLQKQE